MSINVPDEPQLLPRSRYNATVRFIDRNMELGLGNKVAIYHDDGETTYEQLYQWVNRVGNGLRALGVQVENRIALVCDDSVEFVASFFGAIKIGAVPVPLNTMWSPADYIYVLNDSRAQVLIIEAQLWRQIARQRAALPYLKHVLYLEREGELAAVDSMENAGIRIGNFYDVMKAQPCELEPVATIYDDTAFWLYTSGSTGKPKGVVHLQHDMEVAFHNYARSVLNINEHDRTFSASKLFFAYGMGNGMYFALGTGASTVLRRRRVSPENVCDTVERYRPTLFFGVPTLYAAMLDWMDKTGKNPDFSSVRLCVSAGEPLPAAIYRRFRERFGVDILDGIGSTEALHIYLSNRPGDIRPGSTGKVVPGFDVKIVNEYGETVAANEPGQLLLKGDCLAQGYWNLHVQSKSRFNGEWYCTGDRYYQDEDGFFFYCGREDDMLKSGGIWVSPIEVESVILDHEAVLEAAVVGEKDENGIQKPVAYVVLRFEPDSVEEMEAELRAYVRARLAHFKCPKRFIFMDDLPKTATGKIQRFKLRERSYSPTVN
ncbi:MAG: benzoate-CoA ligase family protein [Alicyclobacillus herbarius]|uniref:benzoate-CoA ligase family protein n=1 Tax=Alicyclobacillus herbarius TaxID=122960 RepID=UPI00235785CE|nr:benzoate-CoA ligase family protein [Alicyclobacillus herbarius]MCL6632211.1 benzoate-CoA ligase family protein [Alicyclobacillus herbarius]